MTSLSREKNREYGRNPRGGWNIASAREKEREEGKDEESERVREEPRRSEKRNRALQGFSVQVSNSSVCRESYGTL